MKEQTEENSLLVQKRVVVAMDNVFLYMHSHFSFHTFLLLAKGLECEGDLHNVINLTYVFPISN